MKNKKYRKNKKKLLLNSYELNPNESIYGFRYNQLKKKKRKKKVFKKLYFLSAIFSISIVLLFLIIFGIKKNRQNLNNDNIFTPPSSIKPMETRNPPLKEEKMKVCLCSIGKEENLYIKEFVSHYKKIGYTNIFIYDNNDINGEKFEDILQNEINEGFVSIINFRGYHYPQLKSYYDCYENNNHKCNWLSFFDMDEFLEINPPNLTVQEFLSNDRFNKCLNVKINWVFYYNDSDILYYEDKPVQERFKNFTENKHIKSTVRGNLTYNYWFNSSNPHTSNCNITACSSSGLLIGPNSPFNEPPDITYARIKHYHKKSFEEYCIKIKRTKPLLYNQYFRMKYRQLARNFYMENKDNKEKLEIMKKIFGSNINYFINNLYKINKKDIHL